MGWAGRPFFLDGRDAHPTKTIKIVSYLILIPNPIGDNWIISNYLAQSVAFSTAFGAGVTASSRLVFTDFINFLVLGAMG